MNWHHIKALCMRYMYVYSRSSFRIFDITFFPIVDLLVWGYVTLYFSQIQTRVPGSITFLIGAIIFFNILYRSQQAVTVSFLEDIWSRNLLNVFVAPVKSSEFLAATYIAGVLQAIFVSIIMFALSAIIYSFSIAAFGFTIIPLFCNLLLMGWWLGMFTIAFVLRFGHQAEALAWAVPFLIQPVSAVFYPVSILPQWLQKISWSLPSTYVFEGMRTVLAGKALPPEYMFFAFALNLLYLALAGILFKYMFQEARDKGLISKLLN